MANPVHAAQPNPILQNPLYRKNFFEKVRDLYCVGKVFFAVAKFFGFGDAIKNSIETHVQEETDRLNALKDRNIKRLDPADIEEDEDEIESDVEEKPIKVPEPAKKKKDSAPVKTEKSDAADKPAKSDAVEKKATEGKKEKASEKKEKTPETKEAKATNTEAKPAPNSKKAKTSAPKRVNAMFKNTVQKEVIELESDIEPEMELALTPPEKSKEKVPSEKKTAKETEKTVTNVAKTASIQVNPDKNNTTTASSIGNNTFLTANEPPDDTPTYIERFWNILGYGAPAINPAPAAPSYWESIQRFVPTLEGLGFGMYHHETEEEEEPVDATNPVPKNDEESTVETNEEESTVETNEEEEALESYSFKGHELKITTEVPKKLIQNEKHPLKDTNKKDVAEFGKALLDRISLPKTLFSLVDDKGSYYYQVEMKETEDKPTCRSTASGILLIIEKESKNYSLKIKPLGLLKNK